MQLTEIKELEEKWRNATHSEDKHYYFTIAAQYCQDCGHRLYQEGNQWAIATYKSA